VSKKALQWVGHWPSDAPFLPFFLDIRHGAGLVHGTSVGDGRWRVGVCL
jgi:hypothetical protein